MATRPWLPLPARVRQRGAELLHLQCWLWGCDIRRTEGNLLLEYGFSRQRPSAGSAGSSAYLLSTEPDAAIVLWGFGAFCGNPADGGIYLKRYEFAPLYIPTLDTQRLPWLPDQVRPATLPPSSHVHQRMRSYFVTLLEWIARYEMWVLETCGLAYRRQCVSSWTKQTPHVQVERLVEKWQQLAQSCATLP